MIERVAVYGTLRRQGSNHHLLAGERLIGSLISDKLQIFNLGAYPGALWSRKPWLDDSKGVHLEIYEVTAQKLTLLDQLEAYSADWPERRCEYLRQPLSTEWGESWVYIYNRPVNPEQLISSGDWILHQSTKLLTSGAT